MLTRCMCTEPNTFILFFFFLYHHLFNLPILKPMNHLSYNSVFHCLFSSILSFVFSSLLSSSLPSSSQRLPSCSSRSSPLPSYLSFSPYSCSLILSPVPFFLTIHRFFIPVLLRSLVPHHYSLLLHLLFPPYLTPLPTLFYLL